MDRLDRVAIQFMSEAERRLAVVVKPVVQVLDAVPLLDIEVTEVSAGHVLRRRAGKVVAIHEIRHAGKDAAPVARWATVRRSGGGSNAAGTSASWCGRAPGAPSRAMRHGRRGRTSRASRTRT